ADRGRLDVAIERIERCLALCRENEEHYYEPELHRRRAMYQLRQDGVSSDDARSSLLQAAELARRQEMPRIEALAIKDLLAHFGEDATHRTRLDSLVAINPKLREFNVNTVEE
ncbi:MAG: hypothetical protein M3O46_02885, partial [Myxococcota bacterium]|nr:hypothetical protein [Myxococcota bacterium]